MVSIVPRGDLALDVNEATVLDTVWAAVLPEDVVEHVSVRILRSEIVVGVFAAAMDAERLRVVALDLVTRACEMSPLLRDGIVCRHRSVPDLTL
ncbi:hypothetical protein [Actinoplanes subglobosus]|uniref:BON domain-containing protein n=1 Tax=Actinoplanes subglobosus TaxID=1547892 RepID=A0ABV8J760_9ACTN